MPLKKNPLKKKAEPRKPKAEEPVEPAPKKKAPTKRKDRRKNQTEKVARCSPKTKLSQCTEKELLFLDYLFGEARFNATEAYCLALNILNKEDPIVRNRARTGAHYYYHRLLPIIRLWLDEAGLSEEALKHKLLTLLNAKETKFFAKDGVVIETRDVEALSIQMDALKTAMKARGMLSEKSTREVDQIDRLIGIELAKLAAAGQVAPAGAPEKENKPDQATA